MNDDIRKIVRSTRYLTISTVDSEGRPWAAPVWFVVDDQLHFFWWSPSSSVHSHNISANKDVYLTLFDSSVPEGEGLGLYVRAEAAEINDHELDAVIDMYNASTMIFKLDRENCTGTAPTRLYKASPKQIWTNRGKETDEYYIDYREEQK